MGGAIPKGDAYDALVAEFMRTKGVTHGETAYGGAPTQASLDNKTPKASAPVPPSDTAKVHPIIEAQRQKTNAYALEVLQKILVYAEANNVENPRKISPTELANAFNREGYQRRVFWIGGREDTKTWTPTNISQWRDRGFALQTASTAQSDDIKPQRSVPARLQKGEAYAQEVLQKIRTYGETIGVQDPRLVNVGELAKAFNREGFQRRILLSGGREDRGPWEGKRVAYWRNRGLEIEAQKSPGTISSQPVSSSSQNGTKIEKTDFQLNLKREEFYKSAAKTMERITKEKSKVTFRGVGPTEMAKQLNLEGHRCPDLSPREDPNKFYEWTPVRVSAVWRRLIERELFPANKIG